MRALFHNTERQYCHYIDLAGPAMWQSWLSISHCGTPRGYAPLPARSRLITKFPFNKPSAESALEAARTQAPLLAFNSADVRSARDSGVDQVASWRKPQEVSEVNAAVGVAHDGGRETDEIGRAHDQPFAVDARAIDPPAIGVGDVRACVMVAVGPLEGKVVGEDVSSFGEIEVLIAVSP